MNAAGALELAAAFGVDVADARARRLTGGYTNDSWRVDAANGTFVVRVYGRLHVTRAALAFEHALQEHAAARMPEVVAPLRDRDGRTIGDAAGGFAAVLPFIEGTTGARDAEACAGAARLLARFHRAVAGAHVAGGMRSARTLGILPWLRERFLRFAADRAVASAVPWDALIEAVTAAAARVAPLRAGLPVTIVHGDPNPGNVIRRDGRTCGLIDFDFAHETERVYDVGALLDEFARADDDAPLDGTLVGALARAYASEAPLTDAERVLLPDAMVRHAATLVWYVATRHGERVPGDVGGAPRYAARVREIAARAEDIRAAV